MSNIKQVKIIGEIPFNATEHHDICKFLGQLNGPTIGLRMQYLGSAKPRPNRHGGKTSYYNFCISGQEAVAEGWLKNLVQALVNCGASIVEACYRDVENNTRMIALEVPQSSADEEFVCELRFNVQDIQKKPVEAHSLRAWLKNALVVDLNMEDAGMFQYDNETGESACVSAGAALNTLSPA